MDFTSPAGARLRLAYGTNVAPAESADAIVASVRGLWSDVRRRAAPNARLGLGLWLPDAAAVRFARAPDVAAALRDGLDANGLQVVTVNAFPTRAFHAPVVKEAVYRPDWTETARLAYTLTVARAVAAVVPATEDVPISTLPLGFPRLGREGRLRAAANLAAAVLELHRIREESGTTLRLALEPEPCCDLERTRDAVEFFGSEVEAFVASVARETRLTAGAAADIVARHLGLCLDLCHAAVAHEDPVAAFETARAAGIPVPKVQVSAALEVRDPSDPEQRAALGAFVEPRWLHQVGVPGRETVRDLPEALAQTDLATNRPWRVHFHVPLHAERVGGLPTTSAATAAFLAHVATVAEPPVLEIETYTWSVVPGMHGDLAEGIAREVEWVRDRLIGAGCTPIPGGEVA